GGEGSRRAGKQHHRRGPEWAPCGQRRVCVTAGHADRGARRIGTATVRTVLPLDHQWSSPGSATSDILACMLPCLWTRAQTRSPRLQSGVPAPPPAAARLLLRSGILEQEYHDAVVVVLRQAQRCPAVPVLHVRN